MSKPRVIRTNVPLSGNEIIPVYAGPRITHALQEVTMNMDLYKGVKLAELLKAVYDQGKKDGARSAFEAIDSIKDKIPHKNPGQPKKRGRNR